MRVGKANFLIAMPSLKESIFSHSVILMAEQSTTGALGFIMNIPTSTPMQDALRMMNLRSEHVPNIPILFGGPVQTDFFWLLHSPDFITPSTIAIHEQFYLSAAIEILPILQHESRPTIYHAGVGYSGWAAHQLDKEIEEGSWWLDQFDLELLFNTSYSEQWNKAFQILGADPDSLIDKNNPMNPSIN